MTLSELLRALGGGLQVYGGIPQNTPITGVSTDSRTVTPGELFFALRGPNHCGNAFVHDAFARGAAAAVVRSDARWTAPPDRPVFAVADPLRTLGDLAAEHRRTLRARVVAITGSCGKTTTRELLRHLLVDSGRVVAAERSFNNAIGVPLTILRARRDTDYLLVEIGTNAPGEVRALTRITLPDVGVVTRVAPAHLAGLGSIEGVALEKGALPRGVREGAGVAVLNGDDPRVRAMADEVPGGVCLYGITTPGLHVRGEVDATPEGVALTVHLGHAAPFRVRIPFLGRHMAYNALAALATVHVMGLSARDLAGALSTASLPAGRLSLHVVGDYTVIDDSYNANPASTRAAIEVLSQQRGRRVFVFGGMGELGAHAEALHREVGELVARHRIDVLVGVGPLAAITCAAALRGGISASRVLPTCELDEAQEVLGRVLEPKDHVLFKASRAARLERLIRALPTAAS